MCVCALTRNSIAAADFAQDDPDEDDSPTNKFGNSFNNASSGATAMHISSGSTVPKSTNGVPPTEAITRQSAITAESNQTKFNGASSGSSSGAGAGGSAGGATGAAKGGLSPRGTDKRISSGAAGGGGMGGGSAVDGASASSMTTAAIAGD